MAERISRRSLKRTKGKKNGEDEREIEGHTWSSSPAAPGVSHPKSRESKRYTRIER